MKKLNQNAIKIGHIIKAHRMALSLGKGRQAFIDSRIETNLLPPDWISEKSLMNIELGNNFPSYTALKLLSTALEIDFIDFIKEVDPYMPSKL